MAERQQRTCCASFTFLSAFLGTFLVTRPLFPTIFQETRDGREQASAGTPATAVRKRSQLKTKSMGKKRWSKRSTESGQFMDQKEKGKFKGVRRER